MRKSNHNQNLKIYSAPLKNDVISPVELTPSLKNAFNFIPGRIFQITGSLNEKPIDESWEVLTDPFNNSYIYSHTNGASAWFIENDYHLYFTHFKGDKKSVLYNFYLSFYTVFFGYYHDLIIEDEIPQNLSFSGLKLWIQDFLAPFHLFLKTKFLLKYPPVKNDMYLNNIRLESSVNRFIEIGRASCRERV